MKPKGALAIAALLAVLFMGSMLPTPLYVLYQGRFGFSSFTLTLIYSAYALGNLATLFLVGNVSDKFGRRRTAWPIIGCAGFSALLFLLARSTAWLFFARAATGLAAAAGSSTATAWLADLLEDRAESSIATTVANYIGLGLGTLFAGCLAASAPLPLRLPYLVYAVALAAVAVWLRRSPETVKKSPPGPGGFLHPKIGLPREIRSRFIAPAVIAFATFGLVGFYAALVPGILGQELHHPGPAWGGSITAELFLVGAVAIVATRGCRSRTVMLTAAMGYRGSLQVVTGLAPSDKRAEVLSSFLIACFLGNSVPVVGVGCLAALTRPDQAHLIFAIVVAALGLAALVAGLIFRPDRGHRVSRRESGWQFP